MDLQLEGKRALVTGSSSGIGEAKAFALAKEGAMVVVHGRREKEVQRVAQEISNYLNYPTLPLRTEGEDSCIFNERVQAAPVSLAQSAESLERAYRYLVVQCSIRAVRQSQKKPS